MDETPREPVMAWRFIRVYAVRIVIGVFLLVAVYWAMLVLQAYLRELRIARKIESHRGAVIFKYRGLAWIPDSIQNRVPFWDRIDSVTFSGQAVPSDALSELESLTSLEGIDLQYSQVTDTELACLKGLTSLWYLNLIRTPITDAGLEHLKELTSLKNLYLDNTPVTDIGLEHLIGLTNLKFLYLNNTQVTAKGITLLRKALPNCKIYAESQEKRSNAVGFGGG